MFLEWQMTVGSSGDFRIYGYIYCHKQSICIEFYKPDHIGMQILYSLNCTTTEKFSLFHLQRSL